MRNTYQPRSLSGATREVRSLRKRCEYLASLVEAMAPEMKLLARLAAKTPQFSNPLEVWKAEAVRDRVLSGKVLPDVKEPHP